jgi:hypothetical protein
MTTPFERTRSLVQTRDFLFRLASLGDYAIPLSMQVQVDALLEHFPALAEIEAAHKSNPEIFGPLPPFSRLAGNPTNLAAIKAAKADKVTEVSLDDLAGRDEASVLDKYMKEHSDALRATLNSDDPSK